MRAKPSITSRPVQSEGHPSSMSSHSVSVVDHERRGLGALSKSQVLPSNTSKHSTPVNSYKSFNGHVRTAERHTSTSAINDHSRTPSVPEPSDSDVDSYSDIVGQRSWKESANHQSADLSRGSSRENSKRELENTNTRSWASSPNPAGSVISFGPQQKRVIEDSARRAKQNSKSNGPVNTTRQSVPNLSVVNGNGMARPQRRSRSESQDPVLQNGPRSALYGRSKSTSSQRETGSSDEEETEPVRERRWKGSSTDLRGSHVMIGANRTKGTQLLRVSSVDSPVTSESPISLGNRGSDIKANHAEQLAAEMQHGTRNSVNGRKQPFQRFQDDSQSSQDSTDCESRQTAAERAAAALMGNHVAHVAPQPLISKQKNTQPFEMRETNVENRRLRREHLANLGHLQSSSC